jgi:hypothetical protein
MWRGNSDPAMLMILVRPTAHHEPGARQRSGPTFGARSIIQRAKVLQGPIPGDGSIDYVMTTK